MRHMSEKVPCDEFMRNFFPQGSLNVIPPIKVLYAPTFRTYYNWIQVPTVRLYQSYLPNNHS